MWKCLGVVKAEDGGMVVEAVAMDAVEVAAMVVDVAMVVDAEGDAAMVVDADAVEMLEEMREVELNLAPELHEPAAPAEAPPAADAEEAMTQPVAEGADAESPSASAPARTDARAPFVKGGEH